MTFPQWHEYLTSALVHEVAPHAGETSLAAESTELSVTHFQQPFAFFIGINILEIVKFLSPS